MIVYFTDINRNHAQLLDIKPSYFRVAVAGGAQNTQTNFNNTLEKDSAYFDMVNYCCNTLREQSLITYESWLNRMFFFVFPLSEMFSQKSSNIFELNLFFYTWPLNEMFSFKGSNIIELNLIFQALTQQTVMNVIFIKDSS